RQFEFAKLQIGYDSRSDAEAVCRIPFLDPFHRMIREIMTSVSINKPFFGSRCLMAAAACAVLALAAASASAQDAPLRALFLGDQGHHQPHQRFLQLEPVLAGRGIQLTYTEDVSDLNAETLSGYDALVLYANI